MSTPQEIHVAAHVKEACVRTTPWSDQPIVRSVTGGQEIQVYGWASGDVIQGNSRWFATGDGWIWSGAVNQDEVDYYKDFPNFLHPIREDPALNRKIQKDNGLTVDGIYGLWTKKIIQGVAPRLAPDFANIDIVPPTMESENAAELVDIERERQARMSYGVTPSTRWGWLAHVVSYDGETRCYWRPTRRWASYIGRYVLERDVRRRQLQWAAEHPELITARKLRIIEPTEAEERAEQVSEWDTAFNAISRNER